MEPKLRKIKETIQESQFKVKSTNERVSSGYVSSDKMIRAKNTNTVKNKIDMEQEQAQA